MLKNSKDECKGTSKKDGKVNARYLIFRAIGMMEYYMEQTDREKQRIIHLASDARRAGDETGYKSYKERLSVCLVNERLISKMLGRLEIALQLDSMDRMMRSYCECMEELGGRRLVSDGLSTFQKSNKTVSDGIKNVVDLYHTLGDDISIDGGSIDSSLTDGELDEIIKGGGAEDTDGEMLDAKLQIIRSRIKEAWV